MKNKSFVLIVLIVSFLISFLNAQSNFSYSYIPKKVYATQVFSITIQEDTKAIPKMGTIVISDVESNNSSVHPKFEFDKKSPIQPINKIAIIDINGANTFYTFLFKAGKHDMKIPALTIYNNNFITKIRRKYIPVQILDSSAKKSFCGLIATNCKIVSSQVSTFDDKHNQIYMTIKATEANPEDINITSSIESGIEKITRNGSSVLFKYYFVVPSTQESMVVSYYNSISHKFISKTISTNYKDKPVAAQDSLNPIDSSFDKIKRYGLIFMSLLFLFLFIKTKDFFYLPLLALTIIALFSIFTPHKHICVQQGAKLYIIPTYTSSVGGIVTEKTKVTLLNKRGKYNKIEYKNGLIGWIKDEDFCKN